MSRQPAYSAVVNGWEVYRKDRAGSLTKVEFRHTCEECGFYFAVKQGWRESFSAPPPCKHDVLHFQELGVEQVFTQALRFRHLEMVDWAVKHETGVSSLFKYEQFCKALSDELEDTLSDIHVDPTKIWFKNPFAKMTRDNLKLDAYASDCWVGKDRAVELIAGEE